MQEQAQHKTGLQKPAALNEAEKKPDGQVQTLPSPPLYPGLSEPKQLQEMANKSKRVTQLKEKKRSINTNNQTPEAVKVVQGMFLNKYGGKRISTLQELNAELNALTSLQPFTNLTTADFDGNPPLSQINAAIAYGDKIVKEGINVPNQIVGFINGVIASMNESGSGTSSTMTGGGSGAAAAAAAATSAIATQSTATQFVYNDPSTWNVVIEKLPHIPNFEDLGLNASDLTDLKRGQLKGQHSGTNLSVNVRYHHHANHDGGGIAFIYLHKPGSNNVTLKIYDYTEDRPSGSNQYDWRKGGRHSGPPPPPAPAE